MQRRLIVGFAFSLVSQALIAQVAAPPVGPSCKTEEAAGQLRGERTRCQRCGWDASAVGAGGSD